MTTAQRSVSAMSLEAFHTACKEQAKCVEDVVFKCPMCGTLQSARDLIAAGAGKDFDQVERYLAFSCVGRWTGAPAPRAAPDGAPCNWTLGGFFRTHKFEVVTPDGRHHPRFELASIEEANAHRAATEASL